MRKLFVTGIGTDVGKTIASAVITEALHADYWKPIQAGFEDGTDASRVKNLISNSKTVIHPEALVLKTPASPHYAAEIDNKKINLSDLTLPASSNQTMVIEGAGGLMVPLNGNEYVSDMINFFDCEVVLVSRNYLGSINHTLLSIEYLKTKKIKIAGIIFNGEPNAATEKLILSKHNFNFTGRILFEKEMNAEVIKKYSQQFTLI